MNDSRRLGQLDRAVGRPRFRRLTRLRSSCWSTFDLRRGLQEKLHDLLKVRVFGRVSILAHSQIIAGKEQMLPATRSMNLTDKSTVRVGRLDYVMMSQTDSLVAPPTAGVPNRALRGRASNDRGSECVPHQRTPEPVSMQAQSRRAAQPRFDAAPPSPRLTAKLFSGAGDRWSRAALLDPSSSLLAGPPRRFRLGRSNLTSAAIDE
jgi:hypothetical protein